MTNICVFLFIVDLSSFVTHGLLLGKITTFFVGIIESTQKEIYEETASDNSSISSVASKKHCQSVQSKHAWREDMPSSVQFFMTLSSLSIDTCNMFCMLAVRRRCCDMRLLGLAWEWTYKHLACSYNKRQVLCSSVCWGSSHNVRKPLRFCWTGHGSSPPNKILEHRGIIIAVVVLAVPWLRHPVDLGVGLWYSHAQLRGVGVDVKEEMISSNTHIFYATLWFHQSQKNHKLHGGLKQDVSSGFSKKKMSTASCTQTHSLHSSCLGPLVVFLDSQIYTYCCHLIIDLTVLCVWWGTDSVEVSLDSIWQSIQLWKQYWNGKF